MSTKTEEDSEMMDIAEEQQGMVPRGAEASGIETTRASAAESDQVQEATRDDPPSVEIISKPPTPSVELITIKDSDDESAASGSGGSSSSGVNNSNSGSPDAPESEMGDVQEDGEDEEEGEENGEEQYEVEQIVDYKKDSEHWYRVKWKGYSESENTWEPFENVKECNQCLLDFFVKRREEVNMNKNETEFIPNGNKRVRVVKKLIPPDPRPFSERVEEYYLNRGCPSEEDRQRLVPKFMKYLKNKKGSYKWDAAKLDQYILNGSDGKLNEDQLKQLNEQLILLELEKRKVNSEISLKSWEKVMNEITQNLPKIRVENRVDFDGPPIDFFYINDYLCAPGIVIPDDPLIGCNCPEEIQGKAKDGEEEKRGRDKKQKPEVVDCCFQNRKECKKVHEIRAYGRNKLLQVTPGTPIYECNSRCKCGPECSNRVVQDGRKGLEGFEFCIFKTDNGRGWGVKTTKPIKKGSYVSLYAGEVINTEEAERRGREYDEDGCTYLFDLDFDVQDTCPYTVDAAKYGNVTHFINHSCDPNLAVFAVWVNCLEVNLPKLCLFALRDIKANEELAFNYLSRNTADKTKHAPSNGNVRKPCLCRSKDCQKILFV